MKYFMAGLLVLLGLTFVFSASAEQYEYRDYKVVQGDTLWDISSKELQNSFQWPLIWKENPSIADPDKIYPGQDIKIPVGIKEPEEKGIEALMPTEITEAVPKAEEPVVEAAVVKQEEVVKPQPETKIIEPVKKDYIIEKGSLLLAGYISMIVPNLGEVTGSPRGGSFWGSNDEVYLKTTSSVKKGDMFYVIRKQQKVKHPKTKILLGYLIETIGTLRIVDVGPDGVRARVIEAFGDIMTGDMLDTYYDIDLPYVLDEPKKPQMEGFVVAIKERRKISGQLDVVYIDKGTRDGLEPGDVLATIAPGTKALPNGIIQIVNPRESTSAAIIISSKAEIMAGDVVAGMK